MLATDQRKRYPYVTRGILIAEHETFQGIVTAISCLTKEVATMSHYEYLAHITELATSLAEAKRLPADDIFKTLASSPRDKVTDYKSE